MTGDQIEIHHASTLKCDFCQIEIHHASTLKCEIMWVANASALMWDVRHAFGGPWCLLCGYNVIPGRNLDINY